jgi:hypothetical protein
MIADALAPMTALSGLQSSSSTISTTVVLAGQTLRVDEVAIS